MVVAETYKTDGVNLSAGNVFSKLAGEMARSTWEFSPNVRMFDYSEGNFRGPIGHHYVGLPKGYFHSEKADGIGTKVSLHAASLNLSEAGHDVLAMVSGDFSRDGGLALIFANVLDVASLGEVNSPEFNQFRLAMSGLTEAAKLNRMVVTTGETAELGVCVGNDNPRSKLKFNWAGFALGVYHPDRMVTGENMRPGDVVVALRESGFRSNGMSSVRAAFRLKFGDEWYDNPAAASHIREACRRSTLYDSFLAEVNGWRKKKDRIPVTGLFHITGGGIPEKFGVPLIKRGLSAVLNNLYEPPPIMRACAQWRELDGKQITEDTRYRTWSGGQGFLAVMPGHVVDQFIERASVYDIAARVCGNIVLSNVPHLTIDGKWSGKTLNYTTENL
jgi:phosphoribosylformylglycinamidine cyclo-ligase